MTEEPRVLVEREDAIAVIRLRRCDQWPTRQSTTMAMSTKSASGMVANSTKRSTPSGPDDMASFASGKSFAAARNLSSLECADMPTISIRSGMSRATFAALSPMEPVAPRTTTRRFLMADF